MLYKAVLQVCPWANVLMCIKSCKSLTDEVIYLQSLYNAINAMLANILIYPLRKHCICVCVYFIIG